eukprot:8949069-Pyramimonas_sp.AAC.1
MAPPTGDGSSQCAVVKYSRTCTAMSVTEVAVDRRRVRDRLRQEPGFTCSGEAEAPTAMIKKEH